MSTTVSYSVTGMTCGHCVSAIEAELSALDGVVEVCVDLEAAGVSRVHVTSLERLTDEQVSAALGEVGAYHLAGRGVDAT